MSFRVILCFEKPWDNLSRRQAPVLQFHGVITRRVLVLLLHAIRGAKRQKNRKTPLQITEIFYNTETHFSYHSLPKPHVNLMPPKIGLLRFIQLFLIVSIETSNAGALAFFKRTALLYLKSSDQAHNLVSPKETSLEV